MQVDSFLLCVDPDTEFNAYALIHTHTHTHTRAHSIYTRLYELGEPKFT